jgi:hypothetical protein
MTMLFRIVRCGWLTVHLAVCSANQRQPLQVCRVMTSPVTLREGASMTHPSISLAADNEKAKYVRQLAIEKAAKAFKDNGFDEAAVADAVDASMNEKERPEVEPAEIKNVNTDTEKIADRIARDAETRGLLVIASEPDKGAVKIDDRPLSDTTTCKYWLRGGHHKVTVTKKDLEGEESVDVKPLAQSEVKVKMKKKS